MSHKMTAAGCSCSRFTCCFLSSLLPLALIIGALLVGFFLFFNFQGEGSLWVGEGKITCGSDNKPIFAALLPKFIGCVRYIRNKGLATRCVIEIVSNPPDLTETTRYLKAIVPRNYKTMVEEGMGGCKSQFEACKGIQDDDEGTTCIPLMTCVADFIKKLCL